MVGVSLAHARRDPAVRAEFQRYSADLPYVLRPGGSTLIIGPGGGYDVMRALLGGCSDVTAVEINPIIVRRIMQGRYRDWTHGLYLLPQVHAVVSDGRSYVRRSPRRYAVLQATMVDTWASTAAGALALSESNLYTVEAFREYLRHLQPDGVLALTRWEFEQPREALRVVATAMQALREEYGVRDARGYFLLVSDGPLRRFGVTVTTMIGRRPFTPGDVERIRSYAAAHPPLRVQYAPGMQLGHGPGEVSPAEPNAVYLRLLQSGDAAQFARAYPYDVSPATDDRPFFFYTTRTAAVLGLVHPPGKAPMDWKNNLALFLLLSLLILSMVAVLLFLFLPLWLRRMPVQRGSRRDLLYFLCLGLGYILVEMALIQRFGLFLGHPTYALTVVIFGLLAGSSLGSRLGSSGGDPMRRTRFALPMLVVLLGLAFWRLGTVLHGALSWPLPDRIVLTLALLLVPAFLMGMPFSAGIRRLGRAQQTMVPWAWAVNAAAGVLGSVLAILLAIHFGMDCTLASGALCYLLAELLCLPGRKRTSARAGLAGLS
jgi:spermidine synthase